MTTDDIRVFTQSSIRIAGDSIIYFDPFQMREAPHDADIVFITHDHYDHFSVEDIRKAACGHTALVLPESMRARAKETGLKAVTAVKPGERMSVAGIQFETVAAYNVQQPFHPMAAGWVGYILKLDGRRIYISGDMDNTREAQAVKCDIALVPIGGRFTMDAGQAAELINKMHPQAVIPTHYGSIVGSPEDAQTFRKLVDPSIQVDIKMEYFA